MIACIACLAALSTAQRGDRGNHEDRPQITPQDKVLNKKKITGEPRAVGLLQLTDKGKATLVPIAILINGKFYDASSYKASPVPMALDSGTVYEGERTGSSLGLFTVSSALQSKDPNSATPWIGAGQWLPQGADAKKTALKAEDVPVGLVPSDEPPRLTKSPKPSKDASTDSTATTAGSQTNTSPNSTDGAKPADSSQPAPDKKTSDQAKPAQNIPNQSPANPSAPQTSSQPTSTQTTSTQTTSTQPKADSNKANPSAPTKSDEAAPAPGEDTNSQADANRPKLRRGKPTDPLPSDDDVPGYGKSGDNKPTGSSVTTDAKPAATSVKSDTTPVKTDASAVKTPPQLIPAISDAGGPDPRSFVYEWAQTEKDERRKDVLALAQQQLHAYLQERAKNSIVANASPAKPVSAKATSSAHKPAAKTPDLVLDDLQIRTFDLWTNNQPVIVLTATAHPPLPAVGSASAATAVPEYSIALVARTDIYNNLHKLYVGITDKYHLDVTPRLELIDAVDADGDGRGELLFHETSDAGSGYIIYRATGDTLWKMFDSLSPE